MPIAAKAMLTLLLGKFYKIISLSSVFPELTFSRAKFPVKCQIRITMVELFRTLSNSLSVFYHFKLLTIFEKIFFIDI